MFAIGRLLSRLTGVATVLGGLAIALMMLHVTWDVASRYLLNSPVPGTISVVTYYYMIVAAFIPLAFAEQKGAHVSVEVIAGLLPRAAQRQLHRLTLLLSTVIFALLAARTGQEAGVKRAVGTSVSQGSEVIITWPSYYLLPIGFGLIALVLLYKLVVDLTGAESGLESARATPDPDA